MEETSGDLASTSLQLLVSPHDDTSIAHSLLDEMLGYRNSDGSVKVPPHVDDTDFTSINLLEPADILFSD